MSRSRRNGLIRLGVLVVLVGWLAVLAVNAVFSSGSKSAPGQSPRATRHPERLKAKTIAGRLPQPLHGATAASSAGGLLVIGGADRSDVSTDQVLRLDPQTGQAKPAGTLTAALHDAAAASIATHTLVFGGGAATTFDTSQELVPGGVARQIGHLPTGASDLSAVSAAGAVYVLGGYDGTAPLATIVRTPDGRSFSRAGNLPTAVRYTAVAALGPRIFAFGGELADGSDTDLIQEFDTQTRRASVVGRLPEGVSHASALVLNGTVFLAGGRRSGSASDQILRFEPSQGRVLRAGRLPAPIFDAASGTLAGVGYLAGGIGDVGSSVDSVMKLSEVP
jgi:N-acetylneuraminic acid mutarotase